MSAEALAYVLRPLQEIFKPKDSPQLLVGLGKPDDAAVWRLDDENALVVTTDFFPPIVDDPYDYGAIAAANALSDVYAMGATPFLALNIAAFPPDLPFEIVSAIMLGGAEKVKEADAVVAGGHTIQDNEPKYGLVVVGICKMDHLMVKTHAQPGDVLILTKPLGTGVTTTALKKGVAEPADIEQAVAWMSRLNGPAANLALDFDVRAATDVTGFGFLGHAAEMAELSGVAFRIHLPSIPFLSGARNYAEGANFPGGSANNSMFFRDRVSFAPSIDEYNQLLLFDAQTSGGLLLALQKQKVEAFLYQADERNVDVWPVGEVVEGQGIEVLDSFYDNDLRHRSDLWFSPLDTNNEI
jgi:selenide,water dikinase